MAPPIDFTTPPIACPILPTAVPIPVAISVICPGNKLCIPARIPNKLLRP